MLYPNQKDINGMSNKTVIELENINKIYQTGKNELQVLFDICLQIYEGDFISIAVSYTHLTLPTNREV